jgi:hypothetical protein
LANASGFTGTPACFLLITVDVLSILQQTRSHWLQRRLQPKPRPRKSRRKRLLTPQPDCGSPAT